MSASPSFIELIRTNADDYLRSSLAIMLLYFLWNGTLFNLAGRSNTGQNELWGDSVFLYRGCMNVCRYALHMYDKHSLVLYKASLLLCALLSPLRFLHCSSWLRNCAFFAPIDHPSVFFFLRNRQVPLGPKIVIWPKTDWNFIRFFLIDALLMRWSPNVNGIDVQGRATKMKMQIDSASAFIIYEQWWKTFGPNLLLHNSKSISNFYYFQQSNSLYFSAFRSFSFLRGFRGGFECNDISIQFHPLACTHPPSPPADHRRFTRIRLDQSTFANFYFQCNVVLYYPINFAALHTYYEFYAKCRQKCNFQTVRLSF